MKTKRCTKCEEVKPLEEFYKRKNGIFRSPCKRCKSQYYYKNKEKINARQRDRYANMSPEYRKNIIAKQRESHARNREKYNTQEREFYARNREKECMSKRISYYKNKGCEMIGDLLKAGLIIKKIIKENQK